MPVPAFRNSRSRVRRRRSHHALKPISVATCPKCEAIVLPHRACKSCGTYNNRSVAKGIDAVKKAVKKAVGKVVKSEHEAEPEKKTSTKPGHEGHDHE